MKFLIPILLIVFTSSSFSNPLYRKGVFCEFFLDPFPEGYYFYTGSRYVIKKIYKDNDEFLSRVSKEKNFRTDENFIYLSPDDLGMEYKISRKTLDYIDVKEGKKVGTCKVGSDTEVGSMVTDKIKEFEKQYEEKLKSKGNKI